MCRLCKDSGQNLGPRHSSFSVLNLSFDPTKQPKRGLSAATMDAWIEPQISFAQVVLKIIDCRLSTQWRT